MGLISVVRRASYIRRMASADRSRIAMIVGGLLMALTVCLFGVRFGSAPKTTSPSRPVEISPQPARADTPSHQPQAWLWDSLVTQIEFWRFADPEIGDNLDDWSSGLNQWIDSQPIELSISPDPATRADDGLPPVKLRTDSAADPLRNGSISVVSADALCYSDITLIRVHCNIRPFPAKCAFDEKVRAAGHVLPGGTSYHIGDVSFNDYLMGSETGPLGKSIDHIDALFVPNIHWARVARFDEVWGRTIIFRNIPLTRRELGFSLTKWRAEQKKRDETAAKIKAELEKP